MNANTPIVKRLLAALLVFCAGAVVWATLERGADSPEFVYCPLTRQMQPVHGQTSVSVAKGDPLDDYCLTDSRRDRLVAELEKPTAFAAIAKATVDEVVFDHFRPQVAESLVGGGIPAPLAVVSETRLAAATTTTDDRSPVAANALAAIPQTAPRPPTFSPDPNFHVAPFRELSSITRNLRPRSPPFSV